jgi:AcrR family transcriptional regulator
MKLSRGQSAHVTVRRKMKTAKPADVEAGPRDRSADKRASILNAAAEIFLNGGYLGTSMDEIAAKARVAKQTVYAHFSNKRDLFVAMVSVLSNQASDRVPFVSSKSCSRHALYACVAW